MATQTTFINNLLNAAFRGATYTGGTITMKLFTGSLPSTGGTEVTGGSYAAQTLAFSAASAKSISASPSPIFTGLPTGSTIVAYGIYSAGTLIHEETLSSPFTADVTNNSLTINYTFS